MKHPKPDETPHRRRFLPIAITAALTLCVVLMLGLAPLLREQSLATLPLAELERRATDPSASPRLDFHRCLPIVLRTAEWAAHLWEGGYDDKDCGSCPLADGFSAQPEGRRIDVGSSKSV
jgi:hypothetical protein